MIRRDDEGAEAARQQGLLRALFGPRDDAVSLPGVERDGHARRGLQAYRANAAACAARALQTAFPTVQQLVGEDDFAQLAREHWRSDPPQRGDLGEWGEQFAAWLGEHARLADWPYLADCARLDWALHRCERAADPRLHTESLTRLGDTDPSRLVLVFADGVALIRSCWPIASIHAAHQGGGDVAFERARAAIANRRSEDAIVSRADWKAVVTPVDAATAGWTSQSLAGADLASALAAASEGFDFAAWLAAAVQSAWLKEVRVRPD